MPVTSVRLPDELEEALRELAQLEGKSAAAAVAHVKPSATPRALRIESNRAHPVFNVPR